jgi:hypothetical protein
LGRKHGIIVGNRELFSDGRSIELDVSKPVEGFQGVKFPEV